MKIHYNNDVIDAKFISYDSDTKLTTVYITDHSGGHHINIRQDQIIPEHKPVQTEDISKPKRYNKVGKLECWDVIIDQQMNFLEGSVLKYLWRYKEKHGIQDLEKAKVYIDKIIEGLKK